MGQTSTGYRVGKQPIAQSFFVAEPTGIYVTKVDLFFQTADETAPVSIEIRPMVNGVPSPNRILPGSVKSLPGSTFTGGASVSADAATATPFILDEPLFLKGGNEYALVVTADSKDYRIYVAEINEFTVGSTEKRVNKQPTLGSLFYSQNGRTFTPDQNQDLTFRIHRAKFKSQSAKAILKNASVPKQLLSNNPISVDSGSNVVTVFHPHHGMQVGQGVTFSGVESAGVGGISAETLNKKYNITSMDFTGYKFTADSSATSNIRGGGSRVQATKSINYSTIFPNIQTNIPVGTEIAAAIKTTTSKSYAELLDNSFQKSTDFESVPLLENSSFENLKIVANDSAEINQIGAVGVQVKSLEMQLNMFGDSNMAPMIDLQRSSVGLISNVIDKQDSASTDNFNVPLNFVNETAKFGGSSASKHLTREIILEEAAVGLKILIDANRPVSTDFQVYVRTCDIDKAIKEVDFVLVPQEAEIPADDNPNIFRQYTYLHGGLGGDVLDFKKYQVKIVLRSTNQAFSPVLDNLRVIALST
tara:strand:- start:166 stop:1758 length:1593 start_codon:yes stop_codon:yes gene_type:complete